MVNFSGLKLNRMNFIKEQLTRQNINKNIKDCLFHIKVTLREWSIYTSSFKIVSSFSQLPEDLQYKRYSRGSKPFVGKSQ